MSLRGLIAVATVTFACIISLAAWAFYEGRVSVWDATKRSSDNLVLALTRDIDRNLSLYDLSLQSVQEGLLHPEIANLPIAARRQGPVRRFGQGNELRIDRNHRSCRHGDT